MSECVCVCVSGATGGKLIFDVRCSDDSSREMCGNGVVIYQFWNLNLGGSLLCERRHVDVPAQRKMMYRTAATKGQLVSSTLPKTHPRWSGVRKNGHGAGNRLNEVLHVLNLIMLSSCMGRRIGRLSVTLSGGKGFHDQIHGKRLCASNMHRACVGTRSQRNLEEPKQHDGMQ